MDAAMEEPNNAPAEPQEDDDFKFDAPSYYDLTNPALERRYVNNADGYFSSPGTSRASSQGAKRTLEDKGNNVEDAPMEEADADTSMHEALSTSLLEDKEETFEEVFRHYASSSQSSATSSYILHELDTSTHSSSHGGVFSPHSSQASASSRRTPATTDAVSDTASVRSRGKYSEGVSSKLMQPTQSYLRRLQAEQNMREQSMMEDVPEEKPHHRVTKPRSPRLHTRSRPTNPSDPSRMSSTSRELLKIQEERLHLQLEKLKIREFHEKTKVQRPPTNVHQRSTKQLTIPQSPHFQVDNRARRFHGSGSESSSTSGVGSESAQEKARPPIAPEALLSRDYALPPPPAPKESRSALTTPHSPRLHTASRASQRPPPAPATREPAKPATHDYTRAKSGGLTQPMTPQLETSRRAAASHRRPVEVIDHDAEELAKKFHARPVNKSILQPKSYPHYSPAKSEGKARLTQAKSPKLSTSARSVTRPSASERAASVAAEMERHRREREQRMKARQSGQPKAAPSFRRGPVIPETPPLKSIQLHREYQENFRRQIEAEEQEKEKQRQFRANPIQVTSTPAKFEGSSKPLTEVVPFQLPGERYHEQAQERLEQKRREEEERLKSAGTFRARPMPVYDATKQEERVKSNDKPLTQVAAPSLATDRRAAERAAFDAAEKERREREEALREQRAAQQRQQKAEEIKQLRRGPMIFHARPVPEDKPFVPKYDTKPLTEPVSPILRS